MSAWKPGDVAMVTWDDASPALKHAGKTDIRKLPSVRTESGWAIQYALSHVGDESVLEARPLLVIDPRDREQVERLADLMWSLGLLGIGVGDGRSASAAEVTLLQKAFGEFANPKPPKPDEPKGLGAVVEDADGNKWISHRASSTHQQPWMKHMFGNQEWSDWSDVPAVRVLSEGVADV
ncbi:MAG TPA: hypothetical protein VJL80_06275 [Aeromicrobium sp.]|nr:hypothetical protein [Aeromicrobium sp.]HKY57625.1 hypothetical protein [Aeromicrobium sp.]